MKLAFKVGIGLVALIIGGVITWHRVRESRRIVQQMESGQRCFHCDATDVTREDAGIRCNACGQLTSNELLGARGVSEAELAALNAPDDSRRL